jgi:hypothetical protein
LAYEASSHDDVDARVDVADAERVLMPLISEVFAFFHDDTDVVVVSKVVYDVE